MLLLSAVILTLSTLVSLYTYSNAGFISLITALPLLCYRQKKRSCCFRGRKTPKLWFLSYPNTLCTRKVWSLEGVGNWKTSKSSAPFIKQHSSQTPKVKSTQQWIEHYAKKSDCHPQSCTLPVPVWPGQIVKLHFTLLSLETTLLIHNKVSLGLWELTLDVQTKYNCYKSIWYQLRQHTEVLRGHTLQALPVNPGK